MGTFGYMVPEYTNTGKITDRSDVFSFGLVLLEIITGKRPVLADEPNGDDETLVSWTRRRPYARHLLFGCESVQGSWVRLMPMSVAALDTALSLRAHIIFYNSAIFSQVFIILPSLVLICII
ncbi:hypothetical protein VPH35_128345 [Triticum aestivum]|uniref:probable serine/threonine-protein kinase PBL21 n=1 Tax=Triticum aestivum TaxID=4565 RepID=UPI0003D5442A|nr:probable serine/threonine-protein kinase PBL21 [Triticum aestivum]